MKAKEIPSDDPGLQAVAVDDGPEVVPKFKLLASLDRNSSLSRPEHYFQPQCSGDKELTAQGQRSYGHSQDPQAPEVLGPPEYEGDVQKDVVGQENKKSRICGIRRNVFTWLMAVIVAIVVIAAVLVEYWEAFSTGAIRSSESAPRLWALIPSIE